MRVLFGAGVYAKKYKALLEYLDMDFDYFTDNDQSKWGSELYGKRVISPDALTALGSELNIIISSTHEYAIKNQLEELGIGDKILGLDQLYELCDKICGEKVEVPVENKRHIVIDMYEGIGWGGTEIWAANLAYDLHTKSEAVVLLGSKEQPDLDQKYEQLTYRISSDNTISQMVEYLEKCLPCVFINNFAGCGFLAASIVAKKYPKFMTIVSVIHNDNKSLFDAHMFMKQYIDAVFCVSNQIKHRMQEIYEYPWEKYYFKEQPIQTDIKYEKEYQGKGALKIGYAGRLVHQQKRADLLCKVIEQLEISNVDYHLQIAGDGECYNDIQNFLDINQLKGTVELLGRIPKEDMDEFWKRQEVFLNISEYEGTSLSMLEAMSYGCVPVVTDVSGANEFIISGENGFICPVGDMKEIVDRMEYLLKHREKVEVLGKKSRQIIRNRCSPEKYSEYWLQIIDNL